MSLIPSKIVIEATLRVGAIYKFEAPELISTSIPHYFIVIAIENESNYLSVCTTQLGNKIDYLNRMKYNLDTLAYIKPNINNGLEQDSYINCNDYHTMSKDELIGKVQTRNFHPVGRLSLEEYNIILNSISLSYVNDIPSFLLKY